MSDPQPPHYPADFYNELREGSRRSAEVILPVVLNLVSVRSAVDVGCGDGSWLAVLRKIGVTDVCGVDGEYIEDQTLQIPRALFRVADLSKPLILERTYDLAISLEVAEHLPPECAEEFIRSLTRCAPAILFSAAIPFQGGMNHVNEQWPEFWVEIFRREGYVPVDCVRNRVWNDERVELWYAQNMLLFVGPNLLASNPVLRQELERTNMEQLRLVHPRQFLSRHSDYARTVEALAKARRPTVLEAWRLLRLACRNYFK